ncbi:MAG: outer membrane protein assembly factor BamB [Xanthomonadales bacterium]|nr:Outer membrane protein assembly factor BamB [Xanthomonadales bacterium]MCC6592219.1 outer membrane protein assembly factor BamB [Xanthomonadales bacterium]
MRVQLWLAVVAAGLLAGCSGDSAKKENIEPPTPLVDFQATVAVDRLWSSSIGDGAGVTGASLVPAVAGGRVYFASSDGRLAAHDAASGRRLWSVETELAFGGGPGADAAMVVAGTLDGLVIAFDAQAGGELWRERVSSEVITAPVVVGELIVVTSNDGRTRALRSKDGGQVWAIDRGVPMLSLRGNATPLVADNLVVVGAANGTVSGIALGDGKSLWEQRIGIGEGRTDLERMIDVDGRLAALDGDLYVVGYESGAQALTLEGGRTLWQREMSSVAGLVAAKDGVYVVAADGTIWAIDRRTGGALWKNEALLHRMLSAPVLMGDYVVVGDLEGKLHWLKRENGEIGARSELGGAGFGDGLVVDDDVLYAQNRDGSVGAFRLGQ